MGICFCCILQYYQQRCLEQTFHTLDRFEIFQIFILFLTRLKMCFILFTAFKGQLTEIDYLSITTYIFQSNNIRKSVVICYQTRDLVISHQTRETMFNGFQSKMCTKLITGIVLNSQSVGRFHEFSLCGFLLT